jgi:1-acyl-sn-glycerol-3-phosphate acyltransferase
MSAAAAETAQVAEPVALARWPRSRAAVVARAALQALLLFPLVRRLCAPLRVERRARLRRADGPFVFVAHHTSHLDTALVLLALPRSIRRRTAPAAAEDYFFRGRIRGAFAALGIGAFPFPRRGRAGLDRAEALLADGWSVLLFPEGTRSTDGRLGRFKPGVGVLAARGATVVPIGIAGARAVFPKGARLPRRAPVSIVVGEPARSAPATPAAVAAEKTRSRVSPLCAAARLLRRPRRPSLFRRAHALATSPAGLALCLCWGVAEALFFPVVPDVPVALLAVVAPSRFVALALAAIAGSFAGGAIAYIAGPTAAGSWMLAHTPLVTDRMRAHAIEAMSAGGAHPLLAQPWTGIPFKVFGYQAASAGVGVAGYLAFALAGRGVRILVAGAVFSLCGWAANQWAPRWLERLYVPFVIAFSTVFALGLSRVYASWS